MKKIMLPLLLVLFILASWAYYMDTPNDAIAQFYGGAVVDYGPSTPATCDNVGALYWDDNDDLLYICDPQNTWTLAGGGGDYAASVHASQHNPSGNDPVRGWYYGGNLEASATPEVVAGYIYTANDTTRTILDFVDDEDTHADFTDGDKVMVLMADGDVTLGCNADDNPTTNLECNANTDFTGSATQIVAVEFIYRNGKWYSPTLNMGFEDPTTFPVTLKVGTPLIQTGSYDFSSGDNSTYLYGHATHHANCSSGPCTWTLDSVAQGMAFCLDIRSDGQVVRLDPDASDYLIVDGVTFTQGYYAYSDSPGDIICCEYSAANYWGCSSYSADEAGNVWESQ